MTRDTKRAGAFLVALGGVVAMLALLAGPAGAQTSGGAIARDGSVASGTADATNDSTASGDATAIDDSVASGCSTAIDGSTASGGNCPPPTTRPPVTPPGTRPPVTDGGRVPGGGGGGGGGGGAAVAARPTAARLALTGSWSAPLTATAALAIALGALMMVSTSDRRRASVKA